jgi:hypothetical protein
LSVRKRIWGEGKEAWIVDFRDANGKRRFKTFQKKHDADRFQSVVKAVGVGLVHEPLSWGYHPIEFSLPVPDGWRRKQSARER